MESTTSLDSKYAAFRTQYSNHDPWLFQELTPDGSDPSSEKWISTSKAQGVIYDPCHNSVIVFSINSVRVTYGTLGFKGKI